MEESRIEKKFVSHVRATQEAIALKLVALSIRGWPDRTVLTSTGGVAFYEFKAPGKLSNVSTQQRYWINKLRGWGFKVEVFDNANAAIEDFEKWFARLG